MAFLRDEAELDDQKSVELYLDALDVRESIAEVTYYLALAKLADDILPAHGSGLTADDAGEGASKPSKPKDPAGPLHAVE